MNLYHVCDAACTHTPSSKEPHVCEDGPTQETRHSPSVGHKVFQHFDASEPTELQKFPSCNFSLLLYFPQESEYYYYYYYFYHLQLWSRRQTGEVQWYPGHLNLLEKIVAAVKSQGGVEVPRVIVNHHYMQQC